MIEMVAAETDVGESICANKNAHFLCIIEVKTGKFLVNFPHHMCQERIEASLCIVVLMIFKVTHHQLSYVV